VDVCIALAAEFNYAAWTQIEITEMYTIPWFEEDIQAKTELRA